MRAGLRVAGVDGCRAGWIAVIRERDARHPDADPRHTLIVTEGIATLFGDAALEAIAIDMPMGLPERAGQGGRGPERVVRPLLGARQSSVFSVPSRAAVACEEYGEACRVALATSDPPRKVSKQAFHLFPKVREIDALLTPALEARVFEVHPELAFWRLNGERAMRLPKKVKSAASMPGIEERAALLRHHGFEAEFLEQRPPKGAGRDDLVDACVNAVIAERIAAGRAECFPRDFQRDGKGLRMAIWA